MEENIQSQEVEGQEVEARVRVSEVVDLKAVEEAMEKPNIYAALARAQGQFGRFYKNEDNTFFRSKYLTLAQIFAGIKEVLSELGIAVLQFPSVEYPKVEAPEPVATEQKSGWNTQKSDKATACSAATAPLVTVRTVLAMNEEQKVENSFTVKAKGWDVQSVGSAVTYARRYALQCLLGIAADEDDDGNAAAQTQTFRTPEAYSSREQVPAIATKHKRTPLRSKEQSADTCPEYERDIDGAPCRPKEQPGTDPLLEEFEQSTQELIDRPVKEKKAKFAVMDDEPNVDGETGEVLTCEKCGDPIKGHKNGVGTAEATLKRYGRRLCRECGKYEESKKRKSN